MRNLAKRGVLACAALWLAGCGPGENRETRPAASAGLDWRHFARAFIATRLDASGPMSQRTKAEASGNAALWHG